MTEISPTGLLREELPKPAEMGDPLDGWESVLEAALCERCDWIYLLPPSGSLPVQCPHCFQSELVHIEGPVSNLPYLKPPELFVPFSVSESRLGEAIRQFASGFWFAPVDLTAHSLNLRLQRIYLPIWLVDAEVQANWEVEAGFDYQVVSHQERFNENRGGWTTQEVSETRIRWEPRLGRLKRSYTNLSAPAMEEDALMKRQLGVYDLKPAQSYRPDALAGRFLRLPNREPQDAWPAALPAFQAAAAEECRQAVAADHVRQFRWSPEFRQQNWTLLLLPAITSYYLDDENKPQLILINGQTGQISGVRRASMKRAQRSSLALFIAAVIVFLLGLAASAASLLAPPLLAVGGVALAAAILVALLALIPIGMVWQFNRR
jgi:hypothetical protein